MGRSYQAAAVFAAAAELDLFGVLARGPVTAQMAARRLDCSLRGLVILLDALVARARVEVEIRADVVEADLDAFLRERLTGYKRPRQYAFVDALPKTPVGKVLRRALREPG